MDEFIHVMSFNFSSDCDLKEISKKFSKLNLGTLNDHDYEQLLTFGNDLSFDELTSYLSRFFNNNGYKVDVIKDEKEKLLSIYPLKK